MSTTKTATAMAGICQQAEQVTRDGQAARACGADVSAPLRSWMWRDDRIDGTFPLEAGGDLDGVEPVVAPMPADERTPRQWDFLLGQWVDVPLPGQDGGKGEPQP